MKLQIFNLIAVKSCHYHCCFSNIQNTNKAREISHHHEDCSFLLFSSVLLESLDARACWLLVGPEDIMRGAMN